MKGLMLAAPASGAGKTVITMALLKALKNRGMALAPAKAGPDYIDPIFHSVACGETSYNLDSWAMRADLVSSLSARMSEGGKTLVVEAMMGLFDGAADGSGSAAELARLLNVPVILVVDCAKMSHSVAALVHGFNNYAPDIYIAGLILNKVGSDRHEKMLRTALEPMGLPVLGVIHRSETLVLPERHLGLVQAQELADIERFIAEAAVTLEKSVDLDRLIELSTQIETTDYAAAVPRLAPLGNHIAIARDNAFRFTYPHLLAGWHRRGASLSFFSPLENEAPAEDADAIYLPGGYPELYAGRLSSADKFRQSMKKAANSGKAIYGECGGYMTLGQTLEDSAGKTHEMLGLLPLATSIKKSRLHLGYRKLVPSDTFFWNMPLRGHEFHYSTILNEDAAQPLFHMHDALDNNLGTAGLISGRVAGSFVHIIDMEQD